MAERPTRFEHTQYLGDKRNQVVHDVDASTDQAVIDDIVAEGVGLCFGPDTLAEARNRGYHRCRTCCAGVDGGAGDDE
jgi:hypothetical protein